MRIDRSIVSREIVREMIFIVSSIGLCHWRLCHRETSFSDRHVWRQTVISFSFFFFFSLFFRTSLQLDDRRVMNGLDLSRPTLDYKMNGKFFPIVYAKKDKRTHGVNNIFFAMRFSSPCCDSKACRLEYRGVWLAVPSWMKRRWSGSIKRDCLHREIYKLLV